MVATLVPRALYAATPATTRGEGSQLSSTPSGDRIAYVSGKLVIIRSVTNPIDATLYNEHSSAVTAVRVSPSGQWVASGDSHGTVRVWANQAEQTLKLETVALGGKVLDIAWSGDGQRLCAVGEGREAFGKVFTWDSGNTLGGIDGHSKRIITCAFRPERPFRIATGSDDLSVNWYEGPPFKFKASNREHTRYPNCVRFSGNGAQLVSVGSDSKVLLYDGKEGTVAAELHAAAGKDGHSGAIFSVAWSPDNKQLLTASADKTLKVWDAGSGRVLRTISIADKPEVSDMQVGCLWTARAACSLSLSGRINLLDVDAGRVQSSLMGHNKTVGALVADGPSRFASASFDGSVCVWDAVRGTARSVEGKRGEGGITALAFLPGDVLALSNLDGHVSFADLKPMTINPAATLKLDGNCKGMSSAGDKLAVTTDKTVSIIVGGAVRVSAATGAAATSVALDPAGALVAVGTESGDILLFDVAGSALKKRSDPLKKHTAEITGLAFAPSGAHLASCDAARKVHAWELPGGRPLSTSWVSHRARITCIAWSPNGEHVATGGVDCSICVWSIRTPDVNINHRLCHDLGVSAISWLDESTVLSGGQDACVKAWMARF